MNPAPTRQRLARALVIADWLAVSPPPKPYLHVLRRSFARGLHVLILVRETDGARHVITAVDHGTPRGTYLHEGTASGADDLAKLLEKTCAKWTKDGDSATQPANRPRKRYFYAKQGGGISEPVSRDQLFSLLATGVIHWQSQVWEATEGVTSTGLWRDIMTSLGFPSDTRADLLS